MKIFLTMLLLFTTTSYSQIGQVNQGNTIQAVKLNELIGEINNLRNELNTVKNQIVPVGSVVTMAGNCPSGYREANGDILLRDDFPDLFAVIGTAHGTNSANNFLLPDYRGRFLRGVSGTSILDPDKSSRTAMNTGGAIGDNVGSVQTDQFRSHRHGNYLGGSGGNGAYASWSSITSSSQQNSFYPVTPTGGNETRPQNAYVRYCIKTN